MNSTYAASKLCRACLSDHEDMQDIFQTCFVEVFEYCTSLQVSVNDGLPSALCRNCVELLNTSYYFKQQCIRSDETLKQIIIAPQVNDSIKGCTPPDLKYDVSVQHPAPSIFPGNNYAQTLRVNTLSEIADTNFNQHILQEDKQESPGKDSGNIEKMRCANYNCEDSTSNSRQDGFKCDNHSQVFCKNSQSLSGKLDASQSSIEKTDTNISPTPKSLLMKKIKATPNKGTIKCPKCEKIFKTSHRLNAHIREHYGLKPFVCKICQKEFANWRTLTMHMNKHNGQRNYVCEICKKAFTYPTTLETHKKIHLGIRKHPCTKCEANFIQSAHLKNHMSTHTPDQPFKCVQCKKSFKTKSNLRSHVERHKGIKNYVCSICGKRFPTNGELSTHMKSHNNDKKFQCAQCDKCYKCKSLLITHMRTHTGDLPFKCSVCFKGFRDSQVLKRHYTTHNDFKSHMCPLCRKCFSHKSSLNKHAKSHKKELQGICFEFIDETIEAEINNK